MASSSSPSLSSYSPCAACKFLRRKCQPECVFAPYFPPDQPQKFANVHKIFGASNVTKLLNELQPHQREDAVNSLAYEADMRLRDPVYGCVGVISLLQHQLRQLQLDLSCAKSELSKYQNLGGIASTNNHGLLAAPHQHNLGFNFIGGGSGGRDHNQLLYHHQFFPKDQQQEQQQQQQQIIRGLEGGSNNFDTTRGGFKI
ncbi:protein ASYMMETRIC LEAVES 2-like [Solanum dulcamara]|uniref:protein ASYMMETRIC LEAVES 2-like n=1 Tax=Solanum dulcamara TaxID=45834 RepID=UPI0024864E62|nr:protein ASYMMETRIC LEAVES 2-like [Solanum dulcamara]XP_055827223.1 protein ASYMMETRIC LEAVES 2-like [Solanum dulcamara]